MPPFRRPEVALAVAFLAAAAEAAEPDRRAVSLAMCSPCHGGTAKDRTIPALDALEPDRTRERLVAWRSGEDPGSVMAVIASGLSDADIEALVAAVRAEKGARP